MNKYLSLILLLTIISTINCNGVDHHSKTFSSGNLLITDPSSFDPYFIYEFTTDGDSVHNYTTIVTNANGTDTYIIPIDIGFLDSNTLLILDMERGIYYTDDKGDIQGIWNGLATHSSPLSIGCSLEKFNIDLVNKRIYVISRNIGCNYEYQVGIFVYDLSGNYQYTLTNDQFNMTLGVAGDSQGNIWIPDVNEIFIYSPESGKYSSLDPVPEKISYNGILIDSDDKVFVSVPAYVQDLLIEMDTNGNIKQKIDIIGNQSSLLQSGPLAPSGYPGTIQLQGSDIIIVEVPYARKDKTSGEWFEFVDKSSDDSDVIQFYSISDGTIQSSFGGHSCKAKNILCIPYNGMIVIP